MKLLLRKLRRRATLQPLPPKIVTVSTPGASAPVQQRPAPKPPAPKPVVSKPAAPKPVEHVVIAKVEPKAEPKPEIKTEPKVEQPFKEAFQTADLDEERVSIAPKAVVPVSLSSLAPKQAFTPNQNTQKIPTQKNVADLKDALASIMKKAAPVQNDQKTVIPPQDSKKEEPHKNHENFVKITEEPKKAKENPGEVSKEVLEKILKVD